jgi:hypothetical protein
MRRTSMKGLLRPRGRSICLVAVARLFVWIWLATGLAHADTVGIYADQYGSSCNIGAGYGLTYVYVIHVSTGGATASAFMAPKPACWTGATWIGDSTPYCAGVGCGDSQTGIVLVYGACRIGTIHVLTISYLKEGSSQSCCLYPLLPDPRSPGGQIEVADCDYSVMPATGMMSMVNGNAACPCGYPVLVEEKTWGSVKALYLE